MAVITPSDPVWIMGAVLVGICTLVFVGALYCAQKDDEEAEERQVRRRRGAAMRVRNKKRLRKQVAKSGSGGVGVTAASPPVSGSLLCHVFGGREMEFASENFAETRVEDVIDAIVASLDIGREEMEAMMHKGRALCPSASLVAAGLTAGSDVSVRQKGADMEKGGPRTSPEASIPCVSLVHSIAYDVTGGSKKKQKKAEVRREWQKYCQAAAMNGGAGNGACPHCDLPSRCQVSLRTVTLQGVTEPKQATVCVHLRLIRNTATLAIQVADVPSVRDLVTVREAGKEGCVTGKLAYCAACSMDDSLEEDVICFTWIPKNPNSVGIGRYEVRLAEEKMPLVGGRKSALKQVQWQFEISS